MKATGSLDIIVWCKEKCLNGSDVFTITGLEDDRIQNETIVFPNPSDGSFQITSPLTGPLLFTVTDWLLDILRKMNDPNYDGRFSDLLPNRWKLNQ